MKLYLLEITGKGGYDEMLGTVVRANTPKAARKLAASQAQAEGANTWLDDKLSTCEVLTETGKAGVIITDVLNG